MATKRTDQPRGVLNAGRTHSHHVRLLPSAGIDFYIEHYWIVWWDLRGQQPQVAETLPHPTIHVVIEKNRSKIYGIPNGKFRRRIAGKGRVFGIKFRPGTFYPLLGQPVTRITDRLISLREVFGTKAVRFVSKILAEEDEQICVEIAEDYLGSILPEPDPEIALVRDLAEQIARDSSITHVEQVARLARLNPRMLQRMFSQYVGVSPKWVIKRYRLHEAAEQLAAPGEIRLGQLAARLGYFDQAHFIRDFKSVVGKAPGEYVRDLKG
ncbi:AraC family transcriptional regulator [Telmatocola sphagniphila]|uniref:AraC family transcriptional regulator n=1 Tax=Telmatocola sphagniphila TaxID=1123043 RepID=A0A8E6B5F6_9BACT|nr:helix-turn-helix domain-containing protein [Telmatocola sphagniphila]QVL32475.1 AraC family transcriptional regulator [Telmatocola sphagniphila]